MTQKQTIKSKSFHKILSMGVGLLMGFSAGINAEQNGLNKSIASEIRLLSKVSILPQQDKNVDAVKARSSDPKQKLRAPKDKVHQGHYLVQFYEAPVSRLMAQSQTHSGLARAGKTFKRTLAKQKVQVDALLQQRRVTLEKASPGLNVLSEHSVLFNGLHVQTSASQATKLALRDDVKAVFPVKKRYLSLDASHQITKTQAAWEALGGQSEAGKGIKIAVVDTGIRNENPMFDDTGFAAPDLSGNTHLAENPDYCRSDSGDASFCNNKLIVARAIDPLQHGMGIYSGEYLSPKGFDGHGTHVSGIALGNPVMIEHNRANVEVSGAAPGAWLMVYKALYMSGLGLAFGTDTMLLEALEMAVLDGADIINNSWGAGSGEDPDASIYQEVFANAEGLGIVVVNAAGNTGHPGATINCPACIESGIAVANSTHGRFFGNRLTVNGKSFLAYQGANNQLGSDLNLTLASLNGLMPLDDSGCQAGSGDFFAGSMVLVDYRPFCTLEDVARNVASLGGEAVLIYQAGAFGMATYEPFIPYGGQYDIPVFGVSRENGLTIVEDAYSRDFTVTIANEVEQGIEPQYVDIINPFSSTGPNNDPAVLKPDMAAPGTYVLSAYSPDEFNFDQPFGEGPGGPVDGPGESPFSGDASNAPVFAMLTGTSMASPQVAGAAALLRQQFPEWSAQQIKSALMSTSEPNMFLGADAANAFVQGAGRLDTLAALKSQLDFTRVSYSEPGCIGECVFINEVSNLADTAESWTFEVTFFDDSVQGEVAPRRIDFPASGNAGNAQEVRVTIDTSRADPEHVLYDKWVFGRLTATNSAGDTQHVPLVAYANDATDAGTLVVTHDGTNLQSQNDVIYQARVRNKGTESTAELILFAPENAVFVPGSQVATTSRATTDALALDTENQQITWQGNLQVGSFDLLTRDAWDDFTLANAEVAPLPCAEGCNGFNALVEFNFEYNGQAYNTLTISDNGFVVPGSHNFGFITALFNQRFPQEDNLNNIIAPFWTEFDLLDENLPGDTGGGHLRAAVRVTDNVNYLVVEWDNVQPFVIDEGNPGDEGDLPPDDDFPEEEDPRGELPEGEVPMAGSTEPGFTFQLIIEENSDNIWFNYIQIPYVPDFLSIGAENQDGTIGISRYFDGEGSINLIEPGQSNITEQLTSEPEGMAKIEVALSLTDNQDYSQPDTLSVIEDEVVTIDVMANDVAETFVTLSSELQLGQSHKAISTSLVPATAGLQQETLEVVTAPANGNAVFESGLLVYTPDANFYGEDLLTYRVADGSGKYSKPVEVTVSVTAVNDAPTLEAIADITVEEGESMSFTVVAEDIDSENLTFIWEQTAGEITPLQQTDNQFQLTAPAVESDTVLTYRIAASDGELQTDPQTINITVTAQRSSGGSVFWLPLMLALICGARRKR